MASGQEHDKSTKRWGFPFALVLGLFLDIQSGLIGGIAFVFGGLWFSPDLDTKSIALRRWGILQGLWWPYRKMIPHRSIFSHGPLIGTAIRVTYFLSCLALMLLLFKALGLSIPLEKTDLLKEKLKQNPQILFALFIGLEASVWLHLVKDNDPFPKEWHKWKKK